jgi:hypothetical protein
MNSNPRQNNACRSNIDRDGLYNCDTPMTGIYVGFTRDSTSGETFFLNEMRAYSWLPIDASTMIVTTLTMPNLTIINSTRINLSEPNQTILDDDKFTSSSGTDSYWMMNLKTSQHVKVVLVFGELNVSGDWVLTVGDNPNPLNNPILYTLPTGLWAREIKIG